ncbi:MAG TPA: cytochrome c3 family protein [Planctomycetota bacterium]
MKASDVTPASRVALGLVSLALVLWLFTLQVERVSPGELAAVHAELPELVERGACARCHGQDGHAMATACLECHAPVAADIEAGAGFHGTLEDRDPRACAECHGEHAGAEFALVGTHSFAAAGFATRAAYDHGALDFLLQGRHSELACDECHPHADVVRLPRGARRFGGLDQDCRACHEDAHEGRIERACGDCHGQEHPFSLVASFTHAGFASECAHAAVGCSTCHAPGSAHDSELLASRTAPQCARTCQSCHASPHGEAFLAASDVLAGVPSGEGCAQCHSEGHGAFRGHHEAMPPFLHAATGFALEPPHHALACDACHLELVGDATGFGVHEPARAPDDCAACHGDPHGGAFDAGPFAGECLSCHERTRFEPSGFGPEQHARTAFPLVASHEAVACGSCHADEGAPRTFAGAPSECAACHEDAHRGAFDAFENPEGCARCHAPTRFGEHLVDGFVHAEWTGFELEGAHARAECEACHRLSAVPDERGRRFGFVSAVFGSDVERCETCHLDAHDGRFDRPGLPEVVAGATGCARCHDSESFATPPETFEHERWTGYPLADFHAGVACEACHLPAPVPDSAGRTFGRAPTRCADCHGDPHVGQFAQAGTTDCARCHADAGALHFDHQRDSRFALDATHAALECAACHVPWPLPGGGEAVRYRPLGTECVDCHDPAFVERAARAGRRVERRGGFAPRGGAR